MKNYGIILASGNGSRYSKELPKQFSNLGNKTLIEHTIDIFETCQLIDEIIVVTTPDYIDLASKLLSKYKKVSKILKGGETRKDSSYIGVNSIEENEANVLIHDCARPFLSINTLEKCVSELNQAQAIAVAVPVTDTIIEVENNIVKNIPNRNSLMNIQTPQCFKLSIIKKAHELSKGNNNFTDDCGLVIEQNLSKIKIIQGEIENFKITYPSDIYKAEQILKQKEI